MKKLPRLPMRPEEEPGVEKEIWQPRWKCFCCHDSGIVRPYLAALVIDGYDFSRDKLPRCQNLCCDAGNHYDGAALTNSVDYRLTPDVCQELDLIERENWRKTLQQWRERRKQKEQIDFSTIGKNLRGRSRTPEEE